MEAIEEFQRSLGGPVYGFIQDYWIFLLVVGLIAFAAIFGSNRGDGGVTVGITVGDPDSDSDGGDGGGDGGGGD
jgi:hypothetical protein